MTHFGDHSEGHVGGVLNSCQVKLESVEEMGYLASENKGEICIKGLNIFQGYYKNEVNPSFLIIIIGLTEAEELVLLDLLLLRRVQNIIR